MIYHFETGSNLDMIHPHITFSATKVWTTCLIEQFYDVRSTCSLTISYKLQHIITATYPLLGSHCKIWGPQNKTLNFEGRREKSESWGGGGLVANCCLRRKRSVAPTRQQILRTVDCKVRVTVGCEIRRCTCYGERESFDFMALVGPLLVVGGFFPWNKSNALETRRVGNFFLSVFFSLGRDPGVEKFNSKLEFFKWIEQFGELCS